MTTASSSNGVITLTPPLTTDEKSSRDAAMVSLRLHQHNASQSVPPPLPPSLLSLSHSRRSSIPPPLPAWFVQDKDAPIVTAAAAVTALMPLPPAAPAADSGAQTASGSSRRMRRKSAGAIPFSLPLTVASVPPAQLSGFGSPSPSSPSTLTSASTPSSSSPTRAPSTRDLLDALRLLYSGRVFTSYQLQSPSSPPSQQDWYCFVDVEQPRDSASSSQSKREPEEKEQEQQHAVSDQGGVLYWTVVTSSHPSKQKLPHQSIPLSCISSILLGKQSPPLLHPSLSSLRDDCCFSISTSRSACYSLSSPSPIMLVSFLLALKRLMQANRCSPDQLSLRGIVRRGLKDGVLTALTPSTSASSSASSSSSSSLLSPQLSDASRRAETAQGHRRQLTVAASHHQRSRSQTPSALFRQLADLPVSAVNAPLRSLSPLPLDGKKGGTDGRQGNPLLKTPGSDTASAGAAAAASSPSGSAASFSVAWSPASAIDSASASVVVSSSAPAAAQIVSPSPPPSVVVPSLSSLLSPGDPSNQFTLLNRIGQSPSSAVYRALYRPLQTHVAVKVVELSPASSAQIAAEVSHLSRTHSDYMVGYVGCWRKGSAVWIVQELMIGGSLADFMVVTGHVLLELEICAVVLQCLHALRLFHRERRIHRDVKAANILINASGQAKLADCGTAIQLSPSSSSYAHTEAIGSPFWMAPEVLSPAASSSSPSPAYDTKADIWSLGITALELAYGDPPRHALQPLPLLHAIVHDEPPALDRTKQRWTDEFAQFISLCLVKEPGRRASAEELLQCAWMQRMELEEGKEVLSAMWRAWGDRVERYRVVAAEMERKQQEERERERQRERQLQPARMGPADWNPQDVEYSVSSSQHSVPHFSHHSRSLSPSSVSASSSSRRLDSQSGEQEPPSPSLSYQLTEGGVGGAAGGGKVRRSMSFSQSFSAYGDEKREEEAELAEDNGEDREEEEERLTVMDYETPPRRRSPVKTRRPPVPIFSSPASASTASTSAASPHSVTPGLLASVTPSSILSPASHSMPMIGSPVKVHLTKSASYTAFPLPSPSPSPPAHGSIAASPTAATTRAAVEDDDGASPAADTDGLSLTSTGRRDISYTAELSAGSGIGVYGRGRGEEEGDGDGEEASFSRQIVYADEAAVAAAEQDDAESASAFSTVYTYSQ